MYLHAGVPARQPVHSHFHQLKLLPLPPDGHGRIGICAAGAAAHQYALVFRVQVDELVAREVGTVEGERAHHANFLIAGQQRLQLGVPEARVVQQSQYHGDGNAVVSAQCRAVCAEDVVLNDKTDGVFGEVKLHTGVFLAHHVRVRLQYDRVRVLIAGAGGFRDDHVVRTVPVPTQAPLLRKLHQIVRDRPGVPGAVRYAADGLKIAEYRPGFQPVQYAHSFSS